MFFIIGSSTHKLKRIAIIFLVALWSQPVLASTVKIIRWSTQCDRVRLRVRVLDKGNVPIQGLKLENFKITTTGQLGQEIAVEPSQMEFLSSQQSKADPAYLVMLLDMSGSMKHKDLGGKKKQEEAIKAIRKVIRGVRTENMPVELALVPFGEGGKYCENGGFKVNVGEISSKLVPVSEPSLEKELDKLAKVEVCAYTKIYEPLREAVMYLGNTNFNLSSNQLIGEQVPPRLAVILLSDGYDVSRSDESERFQNLTEILTRYPQITIHTMGYGETLRQLRDRADNCNLSDSELTVDKVIENCTLPGEDIREFIVDEKRLEKIADATKGIYKLPGNAEEVLETLKTFLTTLREYEIIYRQPGSERASRHETVLQVVSNSKGLNVITSETIRMPNFNYCPLPLSKRWPILALTLTVLGIGLFLFKRWSDELKSQNETLL